MESTVNSPELDLLDERVHALELKVNDLADTGEQKRFNALIGTIRARSVQLRNTADLDDEEETHSVVQALMRVVDELTFDVTEEVATEGVAALNRYERGLRRWTSVVDELRVQAHLAQMEVEEDLGDLAGRSRKSWRDVVRATRTTTEDVRVELDAVVSDARLLVAELRQSAAALIGRE